MIGALILDEEEIAAFEKWTFDEATKPTPQMVEASRRHVELRARQQANFAMSWDDALMRKTKVTKMEGK